MIKVKLPHENTSLTDWALFYASLKWPIIPLHNLVSPQGHCSCNNPQCTRIGKHPRVINGLKGATLDEKIIRDWWRHWPKANIGVITGNDSGIFVIDIDPRHGGDKSLEIWKRELQIPEDCVVFTGGDGRHFYYSLPQSHPLREKVTNRVNLRPGIDVRGNGGYIIAPPSIHATGRSYRWNDQIIEPIIAPNSLVEAVSIKNKVQQEVLFPINQTKSESLTVAQPTIGSGQRNNFLASVAGCFRKYGLGQVEIERELKEINQRLCYPGLLENEVAQVAKSISNYPTQIQELNESSQTIQWNAPKALPDFSRKVPNMDESYLPPIFHDWVKDVTKRMQVPIEFIAAPAIVALGAVIGRKVGIHPKQRNNWMETPNLWGAIVARPGSFKSPCIAEAMRPLEKIIKNEDAAFSKKSQDWEAEKYIYEATMVALKEQLIKSIKKGEHDETEILQRKIKNLNRETIENEPKHKRIKTNDSTIEKLSELLSANPNGLLVMRDELGGWLSNLDKSGREGDREFYLEGWNGYGSYTMDRVSRGTKHLPAACLSIFGGIQPDKLKMYLTGKLENRDDGMLQRFQIIIYPELSKEWKNYDCYPDVFAQGEVNSLFETIHKLEPLGSGEEIKGLRFTHEAQEIFDKWQDKLEPLLRSGNIKNSHYEAHLAKYRKLIPSLSLIFHIISKVSKNKSIDSDVDEDALLLAIKWGEYLELHAKKVYQVQHFDSQLSVEALVEKIKDEKIRDCQSFREIYRHHWHHIDNNQQIENAAKYLEDFQWVKIEEVQGKFNTVKVLRINPYLNDFL